MILFGSNDSKRNKNNPLIEKSFDEQEAEQQSRLLNLLLLATFTASVMALLFISIRPVPNPVENQAVMTNSIVMMGIILIIYGINRIGRTQLASWLFLGSIISILALGDRPDEIIRGRTLFLFSIPILAASILLPAYSMFIMAGLVGLVINIVSFQTQQDFHFIQVIGFFVIAFIAYLSNRRLEVALDNMKGMNKQLQETQEALQAAEVISADYMNALEKAVLDRTAELERVNDKLRHELAERESMEKELRLSDKILQQMPDAILVMDLEGRIQRWLGNAQQLFGYKAHEAVGQPVQILTPPDALPDRTENITRIVNETGRFVGEMNCIRKDGSQIPIEIIAQDIKLPSGQTLAKISINRDITERKTADIALKQAYEVLEARVIERTAKLTEANQALFNEISQRARIEEALRKNEQRYRALFERSNDAVFILDLDGVYLDSNQRAVDLFGYSKNDLIGQGYSILVVPEQVEEAAEVHAILLAGESLPIYERQFRKKDGTIIDVEVNVALVLDENGQPLHIQSIVRDISQRKSVEQQMLTSLREKEILLKEIHHRVKNNLQVISSLLDLQVGYVQDDAVQRMFQDSRSRIRSMALVHEQLYRTADLARIDFKDYIERLTGFLMSSYGSQIVMIDLILELTPVQLSVEKVVPLGLIINELVSNAIKHAFPNVAEGEITVQMKPQPNNKICVVIKDNGIGLPADFDIHSSPSLGLTIVITLVDQLSGTIDRLLPERGTNFEVIIPHHHNLSPSELL